MMVLFGYQDVLEVINNDVNSLVEGAMTAQKIVYKEEKTKDFKAMYLIHQYINVDNFEKVGNCTSSKEA